MKKYSDLRVATKSEILENTAASEPGARAGDYVAAIEIGYRSLSSYIRDLSFKPVTPENSLLLRHAALDARLLCENLSMLVVALHEQQGFKVSKKQVTAWRTYDWSDDLKREFPGFFPKPVTTGQESDGSMSFEACESPTALDWQYAKTILSNSGDVLHEGAKLKSAEQFSEFFNELVRFAERFRSLLSSCVVYFGNGEDYRAILIDFDGEADAQLGTPQV